MINTVTLVRSNTVLRMAFYKPYKHEFHCPDWDMFIPPNPSDYDMYCKITSHVYSHELSDHNDIYTITRDIVSSCRFDENILEGPSMAVSDMCYRYDADSVRFNGFRQLFPDNASESLLTWLQISPSGEYSLPLTPFFNHDGVTQRLCVGPSGHVVVEAKSSPDFTSDIRCLSEFPERLKVTIEECFRFYSSVVPVTTWWTWWLPLVGNLALVEMKDDLECFLPNSWYFERGVLKGRLLGGGPGKGHQKQTGKMHKQLKNSAQVKKADSKVATTQKPLVDWKPVTADIMLRLLYNRLPDKHQGNLTETDLYHVEYNEMADWVRLVNDGHHADRSLAKEIHRQIRANSASGKTNAYVFLSDDSGGVERYMAVLSAAAPGSQQLFLTKPQPVSPGETVVEVKKNASQQVYYTFPPRTREDIVTADEVITVPVDYVNRWFPNVPNIVTFIDSFVVRLPKCINEVYVFAAFSFLAIFTSFWSHVPNTAMYLLSFIAEIKPWKCEIPHWRSFITMTFIFVLWFMKMVDIRYRWLVRAFSLLWRFHLMVRNDKWRRILENSSWFQKFVNQPSLDFQIARYHNNFEAFRLNLWFCYREDCVNFTQLNISNHPSAQQPYVPLRYRGKQDPDFQESPCSLNLVTFQYNRFGRHIRTDQGQFEVLPSVMITALDSLYTSTTSEFTSALTSISRKVMRDVANVGSHVTHFDLATRQGTEIAASVFFRGVTVQARHLHDRGVFGIE